MSNLNEVLEFIKNSDQSEINKIREAVSIRRSELSYSTKMSFSVGDTVSIEHKKMDPNKTFRITKINNKNIRVEGAEGSDTVSPSLLVKK